MKEYLSYLADSLEKRLPKNTKRSPLWRKVRQKHLDKFPNCYACGGTKKVQVHHKIPVSIRPDLELDPNNLVSLCRSKSYGVDCHLFFGHHGTFKLFNPAVLEDIEDWHWKRERVTEAVKEDTFWKIGQDGYIKIRNLWAKEPKGQDQ